MPHVGAAWGCVVSRYTLPAPDAPAEEWGRLAVSIPGRPACWDDLEGVDGHDAPGAVCADGTWWLPDSADGMFLDVDHPATAGCLLALLGPTPSEGYMAHVLPPSSAVMKWRIHMNTARTGAISVYGWSLGRACIAAAEALGRWPGGEE